ncbi:hypothetical protein P43SY_000164 [Pythium insidiosum]|uniref:FYVE-type domain-containing protein n=1 Tax=Pythium insidiosum TaxID=114742 RepID=A0AAD5Q6P3_PYTIN|nr:hypothetical protein P43SY_000164 [Pythium insidiosum]
MNVEFPLRDGFFRPLDCSSEDAARWKALAQRLVEQSLAAERPFVATSYQHVDSRRWKLLKEKEQLRVYLPRGRRRVVPPSIDSDDGKNTHGVMAVGSIEGTLEDVVYGVHHTRTEDMRATTAFLSSDALDCAVLHEFERGTAADPFRSLAVKWRILKTPGGSLMKNRDGCVLEYMGIDVDSEGQRFAFHVVETFKHPICPPFHPRCSIRADAHTRVIYRELSPGRVGVFFMGDYSFGGLIPGIFARRTAAEIALSICKTVLCAEAKKLTTLALQRSPIFKNQLWTTTSASASASSRSVSSEASGMRTVSQLLPGTSTDKCSICLGEPSYLHTMSWCKICGKTVCSKCRSRKYLLTDDGKLRIAWYYDRSL